jgi:hypothetical protein|tara:strand:+ start:1230 stop:1604 length:375 start_codon:yes stop_codon:yes gene_type:complete
MKLFLSTALAIVLTVFILFLTSCSTSPLDTVKYGYLDDCPDYTMEELVESYFDNPKWESFIADDGRNYVNVTGGLTLYDEPVQALLQFKIRDDLFMVKVFEIEGETMTDGDLFELLSNMCVEAF